MNETYFLKKSFFNEAVTPPGPDVDEVVRCCFSGGGSDFVLSTDD